MVTTAEMMKNKENIFSSEPSVAQERGSGARLRSEAQERGSGAWLRSVAQERGSGARLRSEAQERGSGAWAQERGLVVSW
ncbi:hypothetical protein EYF80_057823 [Liparis tanakae]|uniref:Uncharacterized protein n=1 Tax=Liparis tanakae TaxID=230148 RepID=A0A4Z2ESX0_9TELE|nr:hypothetical protein EYF80_057823 [Liparis tanakae]